jgi:ABC-2 type transport system permease protein
MRSRIWALVARQFFVMRRSPMRIAEMVYWPLLDLLVWGFLSLYLNRLGHATPLPNFVAFFLGGLILWDLLFRSQQGISIAYLEEVWSRNLLNLFVSPLSVGEFLAATILISLMKLSVSVVVMTGLAAVFYGFNIFTMGWALAPFVAELLLMGWAIGIVTTALVLRFGQGAESLAWVLAFLFQPLSAVFYPVAVLPPALRAIAFCLPSSHVFEGMRAVIRTGRVDPRELAWAAVFDVAYMAIAIAFFYRTFALVKRLGLLAKTGE